MLAISLVVLFSLGSPVIFRQRRSGKGGHRFTLVKFRSMNDRRDMAGQLLPDEERVTVSGRFLRRTRLDELPGLINVARGEMAFVGPRPLLPETIEGLGRDGRKRGRVRPGLTGWAQVNGNTLLTLKQKVELDLWYVDHHNVWLDAKILLRTVLVMVAGERVSAAAEGPQPR
ncbi:sugar transferase [Altererythrobacter sediminis]|uniref:Sugar transferase n=2 Tax=Allopontixanthobacter sediminis TaxID=1689985 RepID=A0A845B4I2_9SPHN|nr:sugar transferase [Allopontixanthobacter sediminis]